MNLDNEPRFLVLPRCLLKMSDKIPVSEISEQRELSNMTVIMFQSNWIL